MKKPTTALHLTRAVLIGEVLQIWSYNDNLVCRLQTQIEDGNFLVNAVIPKGAKLGVQIEKGTLLQVTGAIRNDEVEKPLARLITEELPKNLYTATVKLIYTQVYASSWQVIE